MHHKSKPNQNGISINNSGHLMNQLNSLNYTTAHWNWILKCKNISQVFGLAKICQKVFHNLFSVYNLPTFLSQLYGGPQIMKRWRILTCFISFGGANCQFGNLRLYQQSMFIQLPDMTIELCVRSNTCKNGAFFFSIKKTTPFIFSL